MSTIGNVVMEYTRFMKEKEWLSYLLILIVSFFFVADLFLHPGRSITFDGHVHITTIAQFYNALKDGEFPVRWANGFANYGLPIPLVAHQTTSYLGAFFQFFTQNAVQSYNWVTFIGIFLSTTFWYRFLRNYFSVNASLLGALLFHFAPYRIANVYIRGALPELFGTVFLPVILIGLFQVIRENKTRGFLWIMLGTTFLALTHPMMLVLSSVVVIPYTLYLLWPVQKNVLNAATVFLSVIFGLSIAGYYLFPLLLEIKYFSYGTTSNHFRPEGGFFIFPDFLLDNWGYFGAGHPGPRANTLTIGVIESAVFFVSCITLLWMMVKRRQKQTKELLTLIPWFAAAVVGFFLMTKLSTPLYTHFFLLNNIQYPWRNLAGVMFVSAFLLAWLLEKIDRWWLYLGILFLIVMIRVPQLYGKNFMEYDLGHYDQITANLHTNNMNTLWMGDSREYPKRQEQAKIIEGSGKILSEIVKNASREYIIQADEQVRMVDFTFYFPGWQVRVDGQPVEIQFQDPAYRGMITYQLPAGEHKVTLEFSATKVRMLGDAVSVIGILGALTFLWGVRSPVIAKYFEKFKHRGDK